MTQRAVVCACFRCAGSGGKRVTRANACAFKHVAAVSYGYPQSCELRRAWTTDWFSVLRRREPAQCNVKRALVSTNLGPDLSISDAEIDKWLENVESGVVPAGPLPNLLGMVKGLQFLQETGLEPVCPECAIAAGARFAWLIFQLAKDPMWASKQGVQQARQAKQCKPTGANSAEDISFKRDHYINRPEVDKLDLNKAEGIVADELAATRSDMVPGEPKMGRIEADGQPVQWRAFMLRTAR